MWPSALTMNLLQIRPRLSMVRNNNVYIALQKTLKTLDRALSKAGLGSRTEARSWIGAGRVSVNGRVIQTPDHWVDIQRDKIALDGKPIHQREKIYLLLYKPKGYLTTYKDPEGRPTGYDLMPEMEGWVFPVGR